MSNEGRMQRESNLIATIRKKLPDFARMCADDTELVLLHQDAFATTKRTSTCCSAWLSSTLAYAARKYE
jgi:hypothetical protein